MTNFRARPHFEDRQIQQNVGESITLSGQTNFDLGNYNGYVFDTYGGFITGVSGTTFSTLPFSASTDPLIGWDNQTMYQQSTLRLIPPRKVLFSGNTDTISSITQEDVTNYIITSVDSGGTLSWLPLSGLTSTSCTPNLSVTTIQPCTSGGTVTLDGNFRILGNFIVSGVTSASTTIIETEIVRVEDNNIELNYGGNHSTAVGGGITVLSGQSISLDSTIYIDNNGYWVFNPGLNSPTILSGATYLGDYSPTYTNRSLVDKEYVDLKVSGYTLEQTLIAGNITGTNWIDTDEYGIRNYVSATDYSYIKLDTARIRLDSYDGGNQSIVEVRRDGEIHTYSHGYLVNGLGSFSGITYNTDYSSNYTNRSLVDKEYVDNQITGVTSNILFEAGGTTDLSIKSKIGVNTLTSDSRYSFVFGDGNTVASDYGIIGGLSNTTPNGANSSNVLGASCVLGTGIYQNVFGRNISSSGDHSFTIGKDHINSGPYSSVLGRDNNNTSSYNLISGYQNISTGGTYSSILGRGNSTTSSYVFIAGFNNIVDGTGGAAIGTSNTVSGVYASTIGGLNNTANNSYASVIGGQNNISSGQHSLSFGVNCTASGNYSVAGGFTNQTTNSNSVAFGNLNQSTGAQSFSVNNTNLASGTNSFAINQLNRASGLNSFVGGYNSTGSTLGNFIHSYNSSVSGFYSSILGGIDNNVNGDKSVVIGGTGNTVGGENSVIVGGNNLTLNKDNTVLVPSLIVNGGVIIGTLGTGTSLFNLGLDASGNVVTGTTAGSLEETLVVGNTTGNNNILSPIGYGLVSENTGTTAGYVIQSGRATMYANDGILPFPTDDAYIDVLTNGSVAIQGTSALDINFATINVTGSGTFSGMTYNADYSSNFTNRSLVDKGYVDNAITGNTISLSQVLTNGNSTGGNNIQTSSGDYIGSNPLSASRSNIQFNSNNLYFHSYNAGFGDPDYGGNSIELHTTGITVSNTLGTFRGIEYDADYSSNYTNRSLVDKEYVDGLITVGLFTGGTGTNSIKAIGDGTNTASGDYSFTIGQANTTSGTNSFAINQLNTASGLNSFVGGYNSTGSTLGNFIHSYNSSVSGDYSSVLGGNGNSVTGVQSAVIGGTGNTVGGDNSVIVGGSGLTLNKDNYVLVPHLKTNTICEAGTQFKTPTNIAGAIASNTYDFNCDGGMSQVLDLQAATSASTLTFSNPMEGNTYMLIVVQGSGLYNLVLPSGWWLNDTSPFDFTTLADNDRAMVTATYLGSTWYFAVKELTLV